MVPLLRAEGGEEEAQVLVATEDGSLAVAEEMVLPLPPNEALVVNVTRGLDACTMMEQTNSVLVHPAHGVGDHREESSVHGDVCVRADFVLFTARR